jgi:hypothetical protein
MRLVALRRPLGCAAGMHLLIALLLSASVTLVLPVRARAAASDPRSEGGAMLASFAATALPVTGGVVLISGSTAHHEWRAWTGSALVVSGSCLGPAAGYWYGGCGPRARRGVVTRAISIGAIASGAALGYAFGTWGWETNAADVGAAALIAAGGGVLLTSAIHDISAVRGAVRERAEGQSRVGVTVVPQLLPSWRTPEVVLTVRF